MLVYGHGTGIDEIIDNHIQVWYNTPSFAPLADILKKDRDLLADRLSCLATPEDAQGVAVRDNFRSRLVCYALERLGVEIKGGHFVLFKETETVQAVLEDCFGMVPGICRDEVTVPHQGQALKIIVECLFGRCLRSEGSKDIAAFMQLFSRNSPRVKCDQDRIMRYKTLVWFVYLAIELITNDGGPCRKGFDHCTRRFRELLDRTVRGEIINEDSRMPGFEGGKWEKTLFGWLQGEDRMPFLLKLKRQFNFENRLEHSNRYLLAEHRRCVFEEVVALFC